MNFVIIGSSSKSSALLLDVELKLTSDSPAAHGASALPLRTLDINTKFYKRRD